MNKRIFIYYIGLVLMTLCFFKFYTYIKKSNALALAKFDCVIEGTCPEKWNNSSEQNITFEKFRSMLQAGHQLNALVSYSFDNSYLTICQHFHGHCGKFDLCYIVKVKENEFNLIQIDGLEDFDHYLQNIMF